MRRANYLCMALAFAAVALLVAPAEAGTIRLCTGDTGGNYAKAGEFIKEAAGSGTEIVLVQDTGGTWGNIDRTVIKDAADTAACDAMLGQPDGISVLKQGYYDDSGKLVGANPTAAGKLRRIGVLHHEFLHLLCNKGKEIGDLADLEGDEKASVALGTQGSGAWLIWQNLAYQEDSLAKVVTRQVGGLDALTQVVSGEITCLVQPAGLHNQTVEDANSSFADDIALAEVADDKDFNDAEDPEGNALYEKLDIPGGTYANLQSGTFSTAYSTLAWRAAVYINIDRLKDKNDFNALVRATATAKKRAIQTFGGG